MVVGADHPIQMPPPRHVAQLLQICSIMKEVGTHCKQSQTQAVQLSQHQVCLFAAQLPVQQEQLKYVQHNTEQSESQQVNKSTNEAVTHWQRGLLWAQHSHIQFDMHHRSHGMSPVRWHGICCMLHQVTVLGILHPPWTSPTLWLHWQFGHLSGGTCCIQTCHRGSVNIYYGSEHATAGRPLWGGPVPHSCRTCLVLASSANSTCRTAPRLSSMTMSGTSWPSSGCISTVATCCCSATYTWYHRSNPCTHDTE